jgi:hypothetical protein
LSYCVQTTKKDFPQLHTNLTSNHTLLLQLLERPDILEHKQLSGTLPATLHLKEELDHPPISSICQRLTSITWQGASNSFIKL